VTKFVDQRLERDRTVEENFFIREDGDDGIKKRIVSRNCL
jgi:hypothetical protein